MDDMNDESTEGKWHVNGDGVPGVCKAKKGNCPFESTGLGHFDTKKEAEAAYAGYAAAMAKMNGTSRLSKKGASDTAVTAPAASQRAVIVDPSKKALYDKYRKMSPSDMRFSVRELSDEDKIALLTSPVTMSSRSLHGKTPTRRDLRQWGYLADELLSADLSKADDEQINAMTHHWDARIRIAALKTGRVSAGRLSEMAEIEQHPIVFKAMQKAGARLPESALRNMQRKLEPLGSVPSWWEIEAVWAEKGNVEERRYSSARLCQDDGWVQNRYWDNSRARRSCIKDPDPIVRLNMARAGYKVKWDDVTDPALRREFEACDPETNSRLLE